MKEQDQEALRRSRAGKAHPIGRAMRVGAWVAGLALLFAVGVPVCPFAVITRHPCPGCGLTRATLALLHGDVGEALRLHPLSIVVSPLLAGVLGYGAVGYVRRGRWPGVGGAAERWIAGVSLALWILLLAVWLARFLGALGGPAPV